MANHITSRQAEDIIRLCCKEAAEAANEGNPPFGCVVTDSSGQVLYTAHNTQNTGNDPTAHAEITALRELGARFRSTYLDGCIMFANAESCAMCLFACIKAHIYEFYFGAPPEDRVDAWLTARDIASHYPQLTVHGPILGDECTGQLKTARESIPFRNSPRQGKADFPGSLVE